MFGCFLSLRFFNNSKGLLAQMFGCLLGLRFFNNSKELLARKQNFLPIAFGGIRIILTTTITPTAYLKN
jgi:hypothetical protein